VSHTALLQKLAELEYLVGNMKETKPLQADLDDEKV